MASGDGSGVGAEWGGWGGCKHKAVPSRQSRGAPAGGASLLRVESLLSTLHTDILPQHYANFTLNCGFLNSLKSDDPPGEYL